MRRGFIALVLAAWVCVAATPRAKAGITYTYVGQVQGPVTANSSVTVNLYLQETVTGSSSSLIAAQQGLYSAAVAVAPTSGSGSTITSAALNNQAEPNGFTGTSAFGVTSAGVAYISESQSTTYNGTAGPSGSTTGGSITTSGGTTTTLVYLGSIAIAVGASGTSTTFTVESLHDAPSGTPGAGYDGNTFTATSLYDLDVTNNNDGGGGATYTGADGNGTTFTISPAAVPEPSSMLLCGLSAAGMGYFGYRRRNRAQAAATQAVA